MPAKASAGHAREETKPRRSDLDGNNTSSHAKSRDQQSLGANWQSALCVTSVYDAMERLQQENDVLREELRVAKQTHEVFAAKAIEAEQTREPERVTVCEKHEQEIRLLRREKLQLERLSEQQRSALEARAREAEAACQQQIAKYQEKYALDPNAAKRVALSVQTLRDTLEKVVEEKEELAIRFSQLNRLYSDLQHEHSKTVTLLQGKIEGLKAQHGMQRVVSVLSRWSTSNVERAWHIWTTQTRVERMQTEARSAASQTQRRLEGRVSRLVAFRLGDMVSRSALTIARTSFERWRDYVSSKRRRKQIVNTMTLSRSQRVVKRVFESWREMYLTEGDRRVGIDKIFSLLSRHKCRQALKKWSYRTQVELPIIESIREKSVLQSEIAKLTDALEVVRQELESTRRVKQQLLSSHTDERQNADEMLKQKLQMELAIKEKVGRFLRKQSDRHLLLGVLSRWRGAALQLQSLKKRVAFVQVRLIQRRLQHSVAQWRCSVDETRKYAAIVHRLRNITVVRCFNSWKQAASETSTRKSALQHAVFKLQHQQTMRCFAQWRGFHAYQCQVRRQLLWLAIWVQKRRLSQALSQWKSHLRAILVRVSQQQLEESRKRLESAYEQQRQWLVLLVQCFYQWRQHVKAQTERVRLLSMYAARLQNRFLLRVMRSWTSYYDSRKQARELARRWIYRSYTGHLTTALACWKRHTLSETHSTTYKQLYLQHGSQVDSMNAKLDRLGMMHEELLQLFGLAQKWHEVAFQGVLASLLAVKHRQGRFSHAINVLCHRRHRLATLRKVLQSWHRVADEIKAKRRIVRDFRAKTSAASREAAFTAWKKRWMLRKRIVTTVNSFKRLYHNHVLTVMWDCWVEFRSHQKRIKDFAQLYLSRSSTCCLADVVRGWRSVARTNHLLRTTVAGVLHRLATGQLRDAFLKWLSLSREIAAVKKEARRKQTLDEVRAMISMKWSLSLARTVFSSWKAVVAKLQARRKGEERLQIMHRRWLLRICLAAWQISLDSQAALNTWLNRWMLKAVIRKQEWAFRVWKSAVLRAQLEDVQKLRTLYEQERAEVKQYKEEASKLKTSSDVMNEKLAEIKTTHARTVGKLERARRLVCLSRCFGAWKLRAQDKRHLPQLLCAFSRRRRRHWLAFFMGNWRSFVQHCQFLRQEVEQRRQQLQLRAQGLCFQQWRSKFEAVGALKRKERALRSRFAKKRTLAAISSWRTFVDNARAIFIGVDILDRVLRVVATRMGFSQWAETTRSLKLHEESLKERQQRVEGLIERARERCYHQVMTAWLQLVKARRSRVQSADACYRSNCLATKRAALDQWKTHSQLRYRQREQLVHLIYTRQRFAFRTVLRVWTKNAHWVAIGSLKTENAQLARQHEQTYQELQAAATDLDRLKVTLAHAKFALTETESRLADAHSQLTHAEADSMKTAARTGALRKIVARRFVAQSVARSFRLWRERCAALVERRKAVRLFVLVLHRQLRLNAFLQWKESSKTVRNHQRFMEATRIRALRRHVQQWKRVVSRKTAAKLFLTRRLLVYLAGPQRLTWGFRHWRLTTAAKRAMDHANVLKKNVKRSSEQAKEVRRRLLLAKWSWTAYLHRLRQMRAFMAQCQAIAIHSTRTEHARAIRLLQDTHAHENVAREEKAAQELKQSAQRAQEDARDCEAIAAGPSMRAIEALLHRISQATALHELFTSVSGTFGQFLHGCSAILFLFDPSSNELWTQREHDRIIQVPVSIGITGCTLSSGSMVEVENMLQDPRFHPMVDQLVLGELRAAEAQMGLPVALGASTARLPGSSGGVIGLLSAPLLSNDGAVYGVLQVAMPTSSLSAKQAWTNRLQAQLFARICATIIEQLLAELLRNCRERVRSRTPDRFAKLFKQSKNWRKYYAALERKCVAVQDQLRAMSEERHALVLQSNKAQVHISAMNSKLEACHATEREFAKQVALWKKKLLKLKAQLDAKEALVVQKTHELQTVVDEFQRYRKHQRSRELDAALCSSPDSKVDRECREEQATDDGFSGVGQLAMLRADYMAAKNQLVRAESDNLLLVRALEMARQNDGQLPAGIAQEVARITIRVTKD